MKIALLVSLYFAIGLFTWAYDYNRLPPGPLPTDDHSDPAIRRAFLDRQNGELLGFFKGVLWPGYWSAKIALEITKP